MSRKRTTFSLLLAALVGATALDARPLSKPLSVFESTKLPRRTLKEGPSILGTLPFFNESNATPEEKRLYQKAVREVQQQKKRNEKYRKAKAKTLQVFESTKIHRDPSQGPSAVRKMFEKVFGSGQESNTQSTEKP
ncbi:hypothetical protein [Nitratifractor sp.]